MTDEILKIKRLRKMGATASVSVAITLAIAKIAATLITGSLAVMSSMVDSLADIAASGITLLSVRFAIRPPTATHRYGMGKAEALSALAQSAFIGGSGFFIFFDIIRQFFDPRPLIESNIGLGVMIFSLLCTLFLVAFQNYIVKKTNSLAIEADSANYKGDLVTNLSIIIALIMVKYFGLKWFDPLAACCVGFYLLRNAANIGCEAIKILLDHELPEDTRNELTKIVKDNSFVKNMHDLRTRDCGNGHIFEFHLELDGKLSLNEAHKLTHIVEDQIIVKYPTSQVIIHQEPAGLKDLRLDDIIVEK